jgi:hypothetical protein
MKNKTFYNYNPLLYLWFDTFGYPIQIPYAHIFPIIYNAISKILSSITPKFHVKNRSFPARNVVLQLRYK